MRFLLAIITALAFLGPEPVRSQTSRVDDAVGLARAAAREDRHDEAIAAFRTAIDAAPARRDEWLVELGDQLTWSGRLDEAITLYREAAQSSDADRRRRARVGLGRALARADRPGEAIGVYREVLADHPTDLEARRGLGRALSWRGRHREATERMRDLLRDQAHDREAAAILGETLAWMGRPDEAEQALRDQVAADPSDERAASLLRDLERRRRPEVRIDQRETDQSDGLRISETTVESRFALAGGRGHVGPRYSHSLVRPPSAASPDITLARPSLSAGYRLNDVVEVNARVALDIITSGAGVGDHQIPTFDAYVTYRPDDVFRFDLGASRWTFDSETTLRGGLTAAQVGISMDVAPDERTVFSARLSRADYSDGNARDWRQLQASRRLVNSPRLIAGYRYTAFEFRIPDQNGYYSPESYDTHELLLSASGELLRNLRWEARLIGGYETASSADPRGTVNGGFSLAREIGADAELEIAFDHSSSRTFSTDGFERNTARLTLRARF